MPGSLSQPTLAPGTPVLVPTGQFADQTAFPLDKLCVVVGGRPGCQLQLLAPDINLVHALIVTSGHGVYVRNLSGKPNVLVNGQSYLEYHLNDADDLQIGAFTFKFFVNHAHFEPLHQRAAAAIEVAGAGSRAIAGSVVQIGKLPASEVCLNDPNIPDVGALIFVTGGQWHVMDLEAPGGLTVNGQAVQLADLRGGEILAIGPYQMRLGIAADSAAGAPRPASPAGMHSQSAVVGGVGDLFGAGDGGMMLGGMPVSLPEVAPPEGFGRVGISFAGKSIAAKIDGPAVQTISPTFGQRSTPPPADVEVLPQRSPPSTAAPVSPAIADPVANPRTAVLRNFPPVPKIRSSAPQANESAAAEEEAGDAGSNNDLPKPTLLGREESFGPPLGGEPSEGLSGFVIGVDAWGFGMEGQVNQNAFGGEDAAGLGSGDAAFGGETVGAGESFVLPEAQEQSAAHHAEIEDFSEHGFWDMTDDEQGDVPLPPRGKDLAPSIPETGTQASPPAGIVADPMGAGNSPDADGESSAAGGATADVFSAVPAAAEQTIGAPEAIADSLRSERPPLRRAVGSVSTARELIDAVNRISPEPAPIRQFDFQPAGPQLKLGLLLAMMVVCLLLAGGGIFFLLPNSAVLQGRITFENTPLEGTPSWTAFVADQRKRLADSSLRDAAAKDLQADYPGTAPGILQGDTGNFANLISSATFEKSASTGAAGATGVDSGEAHDLVLHMNGTDAATDSRRLAAVLKAIGRQENDLVTAAAAARQALLDCDAEIEKTRQTLASQADRIAEQKKVVDSAADVESQMPALAAAATDAYAKFVAADNAVAADQAKLALFNARLNARPGKVMATAHPATLPAAGAPVASDPEMAELQRQMADLSDRIAGLAGNSQSGAAAKVEKSLNDSQQLLDHDLDAAQPLLTDFPDLAQPVKSARDLQSRISAQIAELISVRARTREQFDKLAVDAEVYARHRQQRISNADPQLAALLDQYNQARTDLAAVAESQSTSTTQPTAAPLQRKVDLLLGQIESRRRALSDDNAVSLRDRLSRLISGGNARLDEDRQFIQQTLQTLLAQLAAIPEVSGLNDLQKRQFIGVLQRIVNLAQTQNAYATAIATPDEATAAIVSAKLELEDLKAQIQTRQDELDATVPADDYRPTLTAARHELAARIDGEMKAMNSAGDDFVKAAMADATAGLTLQSAHAAQQSYASLVQARDAKLTDLDAMRQNRIELVKHLEAAVDVKKPSEADVIVMSDSGSRKMGYFLAASLVIGLAFALLGFLTAGLKGKRGGSRLAAVAG